MAIDRGSLLAQTYALPQAQPRQPIVEQPYVDEVGDPAAGLQQIDGVTSDYFQKWAALKGFARDVHENLGIDVRYPDPSVPGSDRLHLIYLKALADLKGQGERLKTGQQMYMADRQRGALITGDPNQQYYDQLNVGTDVVDTKLDPIVEEANKKLQGPHFGVSIKEAESYYKTVKKMLEGRRDHDPKNAGYWQRQVDSLIEPVQAIREFDPSAHRYTGYQQGRINAAASFLRKMTNLQKGTASSYKLSDSVFGPNGERVYVSEDTQNESYGGGKVIRNEYIPATKQSFKVLKMPDGSTKKLDITEVDPMTHAKGYLDNARYSSNGEYLDIAADELGYFNNEGEVNYKNLLTPEAEQIYKEQGKGAVNPEAKKVADAKEQLHSIISGLDVHYFWPNDSRAFKIKGGKTLEVKAKRGTDGINFEITNWKEIWPNADDKLKRTIKAMSQKDLETLLLSMDAHLLLNDSGTESATTSATRPAPEDPLSKAGLPNIDPALEAKRILDSLNKKSK